MRPIFIFGCERSGTTLLGSLLGSHSLCVATPESQFVIDAFRQCAVRGEEFDLAVTLAQIKKHFRFKLWNIDVSAEELERHGVSSYAELIAYLVSTYAAGVDRAGASVWVDHTPTNVRYAATLGRIFPEAKFIHLVRDGRAVASSMKSLAWGVRNPRQLSRQWVTKVGYGLAAESYLGPDRSMRVGYEGLLSHTERTLQSICDFADLTYEDGMAAGAGFSVPNYTKKQHDLVGNPPDPTRADAWMKHFSKQEIETFENSSRDMLEYLGYRPMYGIRAKPEGSRERFKAILADALWYRWRDGHRARQRRKQALQHLRAQGFLNHKQ